MRNKEYYHSKIEVKDEEFPKHTITQEQFKILDPIVTKFNKSEYVEEKRNIANSFPVENVFPTCRFCGKAIANINWRLELQSNYVKIVQPGVFKRTIEGKEYFLSCCEDCLLEQFKYNPPKAQKYYYMKANKYGAYSFGYSEDEYKRIASMTAGVTKERMIKKYGEEEGEKRWKEYCDKQAETNTFAYKQEKYGWDKEKFNEFNKLRACTIENFVSRYGEEEGMKRWNDYVNIQKETKSWEYMVKKFGEKRAKEINLSKSLTYDNFIRRHGEIEGKKKWDEYVAGNAKFYSNVSQKFFDELDKRLNKCKSYYASKNHEYAIKYIDSDDHCEHTYMLDYYLPDLKICVEFNGDLWHANPEKYKATDYPCPFSTKTAQEIWDTEEKRTKTIESYGIKVVKIWESEYNEPDFDIYEFITEKMGIELDI